MAVIRIFIDGEVIIFAFFKMVNDTIFLFQMDVQPLPQSPGQYDNAILRVLVLSQCAPPPLGGWWHKGGKLYAYAIPDWRFLP